VIFFLGLSACGRINFDPLDFATGDASGDGFGSGVSCSPSSPFTTVRPISELNTATEIDGALRLTPDERTACFHAQRGGGMFTVYFASRADRTLPFEQPTVGLTGVTFDVYWPALTSDALTLFADDTAEVYLSNRADRSQPFSGVAGIGGVSTPGTETTPFLTIAGDRLYFTRDGAVYETPWPQPGPVAMVAGLDTLAVERAAVLSLDEHVVYFARKVGATEHIFVATRPDRQSPFTNVAAVAEVSSPMDEAPTWLSPDLCRLYFESARTGVYDIYIAERTP